MSAVKRYLITTADERTWRFDRPVIFLGEWCRLYSRKHIWQNMDAIISEPYGLGKALKDSDHAEARALEEKIFPILCNILNQHHNTQYSERFWRIVLGHWFQRYIDVILNRVKTLEQCLQSNQLSGTVAFDTEHYSLAPLDSYAAIWAFNDDRWNNTLYVKILNLLGDASCPFEVISGNESKGILRTPNEIVPLKSKILKWIYHKLRVLAKVFIRENDALIINTYLPKVQAIKLQLSLGQIPQLFDTTKEWQAKKIDRVLRHNLSKLIFSKENDTLFGIMCSLVFELLPVCYLENFPELSKNVQRLTWPKAPKFIFTSNSFDTDELFKLWTAQKVDSGFKYIVGQHGNNYGTERYQNPTVEESTSDKFMTWGWTDRLPQHIPSFIFKTVVKSGKAYNPDGGLLLIEDMLYHRLNTWDRAYEFEIYFEEQTKFVDNLEKTMRDELTIRIHPSYKLLRSFDVLRWNDYDSHININTGEDVINKLISQSRLIVHGYDSTGILETLSQNIPTLAFWQNDLDHLRDSAIPYYQILVDAGIVHLTPESVASKVNEIWHDVETWWEQSSIQDARNKFCSHYARVSQNPSQDLRKLLQ
jgi:putative transferase (TIGR04331 family)